jgi:hypothetical protein
VKSAFKQLCWTLLVENCASRDAILPDSGLLPRSKDFVLPHPRKLSVVALSQTFSIPSER